ncbi:hypothetical protein [Nocardia donostiensis]|uniref:Uncharacterized protein n=1 Tax=Nocardia donostiensis TaxID=1538463 RepID=A0A1V2T8S8_9NOCA|nr:hypothetical protein [Nocardia donostiensis]ONM45926.1 hypothetical protein B0T46_25780 [Nocardia donostiensis]OQS12434.1 hypothetical protein B0T36_24950 [Nocardia donostiensis]OQS16084.1 hypothetical protein B0T44_25555 [Nocardia donostiensis]
MDRSAGEAASSRWRTDTETDRLTQRLLPFQHSRHLTDEEVDRLAGLTGHIVDLDLRIDIDIDAELPQLGPTGYRPLRSATPSSDHAHV